MIKCESCAWENPLHAAFCTNCGSELDRAEMSISADMSASDELSLDGSESNLIIEAAKESAQKQRADASEPQAAVVESPSDANSLDAVDDAADSAIANRATLQLNVPSDQMPDVSDDAPTSEPEGVDDVQSEDEVLEADSKDRANGSADDMEPPSSTEDEVGSEDGEGEQVFGEHEGETPAPENSGLLAAAQSSVPAPQGERPSESQNESASGDDKVAYVAFDDGIPDEDDVTDMSMQSLDVGVESLSMDDSLYLGELHSGEIVEEATDVHYTSETPASETVRSFSVRACGTKNTESQLFEVPDGGLTLGRTFEGADLSDPFISPSHCRLSKVDGHIQVTDLDSMNGTWIRMSEVQDLRRGDRIRLGNQVFTLERKASESASADSGDDTTPIWQGYSDAGDWYLTSSNRLCVPIPESGLRIGRFSGTLVFENDSDLSSAHAILLPSGELTQLKDFNSRTGSWLRVEAASDLFVGGEFMLGNTRFKVELS